MINITQPTPYENLKCIGRPDITIKLECEQFSNSFKARGIESFINSTNHLNGLVTYTTGNHGVAVSALAKLIGVKATIISNYKLNSYKKYLIQELGGEIILINHFNINYATEFTLQTAEKNNYTFIPLYDNLLLLNGYSQIGTEICNDFKQNLWLFFPVGSGSLLLANAKKIKQTYASIKITAVEPLVYQRMAGNSKLGKPSKSIADCLSIDHIPKCNTEMYNYIDTIQAVSESEIIDAMLLIYNRFNLMIEPGGAVTLAAALKTKMDEFHKIALITGKNISNKIFNILTAKNLPR